MKSDKKEMGERVGVELGNDCRSDNGWKLIGFLSTH